MKLYKRITRAALAAFTVSSAALVCAAADPAPKAAAPEIPVEEQLKMDAEVAYVNALVDNNFPDIAAPVIEAAKKKWPVLGAKLKVAEMNGELRLGHFDVVQKAIDALTDKKGGEYWGLSLAMADAYHARGDMKSCRKIYGAFFKTFKDPTPELKSFFIESSYKWSQILVNEKNFDEAATRYEALLRQKFAEDAWAAVATDATELFIRLAGDVQEKDKAKAEKYLARATKIVDQLLWKSDMGVVFGRAVSMKAHVEMMRGNVQKAQELVNEYMPQLKEIHDTLLEQDPDGKKGYVRLSPMPECRYLLAKMLWEAAKVEIAKPDANWGKITDILLGARGADKKRSGLGAFNHAVNVYINYPFSAWAMQAGQLVDEIAAVVKKARGKDLKAAMKVSPKQMEKVRLEQFKTAYNIFGDGEYAKAVEAYHEVLTQLPETYESIDANSNLAEAYVQIWKQTKEAKEKEYYRLCANAVEGYFCERFSGAKENFRRRAGDQVLRVAMVEHTTGSRARADELYKLYFACYPTHYQAPQTALSLAGESWKAGDYERAIKYYDVIATVYTNSANYAAALQMLSACHGKLGHHDEEVQWLRAYAEAAKRPIDRIPAVLSLAQMQRNQGFDLFAAAETNEADKAALQKKAFGTVLYAVKDFKAVDKAATEAIDSKMTAKTDKPKFQKLREQALRLEGDALQRLTWPAEKLGTFRAGAVKAYERFLALYPKSKAAPATLVKIGTIWTAEKNGEKAKDAFARLKKDFPDSEEAKNSTPRLAKTLIEMGLKSEGVEQYEEMIRTAANYTPRQFLDAGEALLDAKSWDNAQAAFAKAGDMAKEQGQTNVVARALVGKAKVYYKAGRLQEAHEVLDQFIADERFARSVLVVDAYVMMIDVASAEGRSERDDNLRMKYFNAAVGAIKKVRMFRKEQAQQDELDLMSGDVLVRKMEAEESMNLAEQAKETCARAAVTFQAYLMAHEPTAEHPASEMTPQQLANLERCYATALPLMARLGKDQADQVVKYAEKYQELFPNGKGKTAVQNALNQAKAE